MNQLFTPIYRLLLIACIGTLFTIHCFSEEQTPPKKAFSTLKTTDGEELRDVSVTAIDLKGVSLSHSDGAGRFEWTRISKADQIAMGFDAEKLSARSAAGMETAQQKACEVVPTKFGDMPGYCIDYDFILLRSLNVNEIIKLEAGGSIIMAVPGDDRFLLMFFNTSSPENRDSKYKGYFPAQGLFEFKDSEADSFISIIKKFLEWDAVSDQQRLKDITKNIATLGGYTFSYHRSELGQGWCEIEITDPDLVRKSMARNITVFPPAAIALINLIDFRSKLRAEYNAGINDKARMQKKADDILK